MAEPAALTVEALAVDFNGLRAVDGVSMVVEKGELRVLLGANGAGKTTLMDLVSGKTKSTEGRVFLYDAEITNWEEHRVARAGIGRKFQIPSVFKDLTVRRNLEVASCEKTGVLANLGFGFSSDAEARVGEVLRLVGLEELADRPATSLSHGQTQWLELGMLIVQNRSVLLLDEPTAGMTQAETHKTAQLINRLKGQHTILVVEHDMAFVREIAERITVMHLGRVLAEGSVAEIEQNEDVRRAYLGSAVIHGQPEPPC
ncbi:urea ABC transporter ATP-binding protein UrtD [Propylenella binzhouense]|uniref:Urea ABC transporter ATP-binding protein UrtD n=1 Tax=Propylenella binzhouense TaxID=2555902 RepID=A0A964T6Q9_9HYPH|nr:urea ABC transporter ATP-binding protein UrtD [Propylenella binzhouense]MYZ49434.1 urea ABC transporter ATP-binding protein UrtD [Propylenella binzhouense]